MFTAVEGRAGQQQRPAGNYGKEEDSGPRTEAKGVPILLVQEKQKGPVVETKESRRHGTLESPLLLCISPSPEPSTAAPPAVLVLLSKLLHNLNSPESLHRSELLLPQSPFAAASSQSSSPLL